MKRNIVVILTLLTSIMSIAFIDFLLAAIKNPAPDAAFIQKTFIWPADYFQPEPRERMQYIVSAILFPIFCAGFYLLFKSLIQKIKGSVKYLHLFLSVITVVVIFALALAGNKNTQNLYISPTSLREAPLLSLVFFIASIIILFSHQYQKSENKQAMDSGYLYFFFGICLTTLIAAGTIFGDGEAYVPQLHFIAYFDSVVQTYLGKTLLVNNNAQYGLYPVILKPIFQIFGLSVFKFTLVMGLLKGLAFFSLLVLLWFTVKNKLIAFFGFATLAFYSQLRIPIDMGNDPYFQYVPHRLIFPAAFLCFVWVYIAARKGFWGKVLFYFISTLCGIAVFWNLDSGLIVFATWILTLLYIEFLTFKQKGFIKTFANSIIHVLTATIPLLILGLGFYVITYAGSGGWPVISDLLVYPQLFYRYGFFLLPITQAIHPWNMVVLIEITGVFFSIRHLLDTNEINLSSGALPAETRIQTTIFAISILAIGLFNYYIGRSHDYNLIGPSWPVVLLLTIFTDRIFSGLSRIDFRKSPGLIIRVFLSSRWMYKVFLFLAILLIISTSILSIAIHAQVYYSLIKSRMADVRSGMPMFLTDDIEFIKAHTQKADEVLIFSNYAPELYLYTNTTRGLPVPGFGFDLIFKSDLEKITGFLKAPPPNAKIYWDPDFTFLTPTQFENLTPIAYSKNKHLILYENKQK